MHSPMNIKKKNVKGKSYTFMEIDFMYLTTNNVASIFPYYGTNQPVSLFGYNPSENNKCRNLTNANK